MLFCMIYSNPGVKVRSTAGFHPSPLELIGSWDLIGYSVILVNQLTTKTRATVLTSSPVFTFQPVTVY